MAPSSRQLYRVIYIIRDTQMGVMRFMTPLSRGKMREPVVKAFMGHSKILLTNSHHKIIQLKIMQKLGKMKKFTTS